MTLHRTVLIKGAGDLASGIACRLHQSGFSVVMTDLPVPTAVRRTVAFSRCVYEDTVTIEQSSARLCHSLSEIHAALNDDMIAVVVDPEAKIRTELNPDVVVDAIIAKTNLGTTLADAPVVIAVGPGFTAGVDCHCVVETKRGHYLGRCIYDGSAIANTGIPGDIGGYTVQRILRAPADGIFHPIISIGTIVEPGDICGVVFPITEISESADHPNVRSERTDGIPMRSEIPGVVRGLLQDGVPVTKGLKSGDVDPRCAPEHCSTVSDKARAIGGGVLEAILHLLA